MQIPFWLWNSGQALAGLLGQSWEFSHAVYMSFVDLEKANNLVPQGVLWGVLREYGVLGPLLRTIWSLYNQSESCVRILGTKSNTFLVNVGLCQDSDSVCDIHGQVQPEGGE